MISRRCTSFSIPPILLSLALIFLLSGRTNAQSIDIGVLEESVTPNDANNELRSGIRLLFKKTDLGWQAICNSTSTQSKVSCDYAWADKPMDWFVQNNGKQLATLQTQDWLVSQSSSDIGLLKITDGLVPIVGEKSSSYSAWTKVPVHRPLIVSSTPLNTSAHTWEEVVPDKRDMNLVWPSFRKFIPKVEMCMLDKQGKQTKSKARDTTMTDIDIDHVWESAQKNRLIHVRIKPDVLKKCGAANASKNQLWLHQTLVRKLYKLPDLPGDIIYPIDFGDFGGDSHEMALFQINGDKVAGYALYFNNFQDHIRYTWNYR